jgi:hypothetical protein
MSQHSTHREAGQRLRPARPTLTATDLVATGRVSAQQAYAATLVLARLHDRGVALNMNIEEMCEVLGYLGDGRRPSAVPADQVAPPHLRGRPEAEAS